MRHSSNGMPSVIVTGRVRAHELRVCMQANNTATGGCSGRRFTHSDLAARKSAVSF